MAESETPNPRQIERDIKSQTQNLEPCSERPPALNFL
jgi:hypothetical protein